MRLSLIYSAFKSAWWWLIHFVTAGKTRVKRISSPKVKQFVTQVIRVKKVSEQIKSVEKYIKALEKDSSEIHFIEKGAGSRAMKKTTRKVSFIAKLAGCSRKQGRLLYRMVDWYKPTRILELGTSLGKSAFYMASANEKAAITTIDINKSVLELAKRGARKLNLNNISFIEADFDNILSDELKKDPDLVYVDGNHSYKGTMKYFNEILNSMTDGMIVFDDIYWSSGMKKAWNEIQTLSNCSIDLYWLGIVIVSQSADKGKYNVRF